MIGNCRNFPQNWKLEESNCISDDKHVFQKFIDESIDPVTIRKITQVLQQQTKAFTSERFFII
jgi:hypothetical protein